MSQPDYQDTQCSVAYLVNNAVLAHTHTVQASYAGEFLASGWPGVFPKQCYPANQALSILLRGNRQKFFSGRGLD